MPASQQLADWRNPAVIEGLTRPGYNERLFYHTYEHALETRDIARELGKLAVYNGKDVDFYVLEWAALGHDYGYLEYESLPSEIKQEYDSREKYAAAMVGGIMANYHAPQEKIQRVKEAIWSTQVLVLCQSEEAKIIRQADLSNVASENPAPFFLNTIKLYREWRLLQGKNPNVVNPHEFISYALSSAKFLDQYNKEDVSLGDFDRDENGQSIFCKLAAKNIQQLFPKHIKELAHKAGSTLLKDIDIA
jgi:hypothetical protein